jgi:hypothetical protein
VHYYWTNEHFLTKRIKEVGNIAGLFVCHGRMARNTQFLTVDALGNRK